ncbi:restriction endonuclease subunit S [Staphylococcus equorum]|uniref:restriction endonuclease subunit S n=1 Tax=Staphylococcus equorum TaxID=246432 RepID=UPI00256A908C|nr:restriction endonuclease subunit S [Staphylococcus equorum]
MFRIQPDLRFPRFKEPWKKTVLGDISKRPMYGVGASAVEFNNKDVYVRITDIEDKSRKLMSRNFTSPSIVNEKYLLKDKDILFARTGASTGKTYIHENYEMKYDYYFAGFLIKFEILKSYYPDFVYQYTLTNSYENWIKVMSVRSGQPGINSEEYSKLKLNIPRYEEQKKIGDFFSKLDRQIELEEQKLEKLKEQKKGYMQKIFSQEIRFKDDNGNDYPEWESKKFLDIFKLVPSKNNQIKSSEVVENGIIPVVDQGKDIFLGYSNEKDKAIEDFDNVIVYGDHTTIIKYIKEPFIIGGDGVKLLESNDGSLIHYLYILLQYFNVKPEGYKRHYSILKNKMMNISNTKEEQEKIGDFFNELDELIEKQSSKIVVLKQRKKGFLQKMFV